MKYLILFFLPVFAFAENSGNNVAPPANNTPTKSKKDAVQYKKNTKLEFEGRDVDGNVVNPDSADVEGGNKSVKFNSMLDGRKDFKPEFKRSSEELQ